jgi:hypothetical protein
MLIYFDYHIDVFIIVDKLFSLININASVIFVLEMFDD